MYNSHSSERRALANFEYQMLQLSYCVYASFLTPVLHQQGSFRKCLDISYYYDQYLQSSVGYMTREMEKSQNTILLKGYFLDHLGEWECICTNSIIRIDERARRTGLQQGNTLDHSINPRIINYLK